MNLAFPFRKEKSTIFGSIYRPIAQVSFWSQRYKMWEEITVIVDTGADYTLLPNYLADMFGIDLETEAQPFSTQGVGGKEIVYIVPKHKVLLGKWERTIPVGFLERNTIPPVIGRHMFLETFETHFSKNQAVIFRE
jgi:hypothetical protein